MVEFICPIVMLMLTVAFAAAFVRVAIGPTLPDRVVALDMAATIVVALILTHCVQSGSSYYIPAAISIALLSFIGTVIGGLLSIVAAVGVIRLPDLFTRMHAATKTGTVGVSAIVIGMMIHFSSLTITSRGILVIAFFLLTAPVAAHMIGRAAYRSGVSLWLLTRIDEWKTHGEMENEDG
jgi:multicomponent Na+:H+ antiporter subunit G